MKIEYTELENKAEQALRKCLEKVPFLKIESFYKELLLESSLRPNFIVSISLSRFSSTKQKIIIEVKNSGQPRIAREAVNQLLRYLTIYPDSYAVFIAPYISKEAAEICSRDGIGYVDFAGNCRLSYGQIYIEQRGNPNICRQNRDLRSLYSPKAARILRVLLNNPKKYWKMNDLSIESQVSLGQVANVKKLLDAREWIVTNQDGFSLRESEKLLEEWSQSYTYRKNLIRNFFSLDKIEEIESNIAKTCDKQGIKYALTSFSGAARFAPFVRYQRVMAYVNNNGDELPDLLNLKEVDSGPNVTLLFPYDEGVFYASKMIDDIKVVSPIQIYLDLAGSPGTGKSIAGSQVTGRGKEASNFLLEEVIKPSW